MTVNTLFTLFIALLLLAPVPAVWGKTLYQWIDAKGVAHVIDDPRGIPPGAQSLEIIDIDPTEEGEGDESGPAPPNTDPDIEEEDRKRAAELAAYLDKLDAEERAERKTESYWKDKAYGIKAREDYLTNEVSALSTYMVVLKEEIDWYLSNGYAADRYIRELRDLEGDLSGLKMDLDEIPAAWERLEDEARRAGVPPGYARP